MSTPVLGCLLLFVCSLLGSGLCRHPLLVFLIDGFRYDYLKDLEELPGFAELVHNGVQVDYMTPDFPSLSYPNYYSLMTGRHCDIHQMTGNYMWDQASRKEFLIGTNPDSRLPLWWEGSEPLWVTMQKQRRNVYMYYWPGCEVSIMRVRPAFCEEYIYNPSDRNFTESIEHALEALRRGSADMAAIYYEKVDVEGHHHGPLSAQVRSTVRQLDAAFQILNRKMKEKNMQDSLNVMMFSDHGMTDIQWMQKVIELRSYINMSDVVKMMDRGPVVSLWPKASKFEAVYKSLQAAGNMKVYKKHEIPERLHYKGGRFVSTLTLVADPGWFITESIPKLPYWQNGTGDGWQRGWHGYDNEFIDMRGFFIASGPEFKRNVRVAPIRAVDIYNLMCHALGLQPQPNNGSWSRVEYMLRGRGDVPVLSSGAMVLMVSHLYF